MCSRCNIIQRLTGVEWGSSASTLRTSAIALVYSTAEYCSPVWSHSTHVKKVDTALHSCLRIVTGTIKSTPIPWLSVLANIQPPDIRRKIALCREYNKIADNADLPIHEDLTGRVGTRLVSRNPLWLKVNELNHFRPEDEWKRKWNDAQLFNAHLVADPNDKLKGQEIDRRTWTQLNRIRTNHGQCNHVLNKWNPTVDPKCDCGHPDQTIHHIVNECPMRKFSGGLHEINDLTDEAIEWIRNLDVKL